MQLTTELRTVWLSYKLKGTEEVQRLAITAEQQQKIVQQKLAKEDLIALYDWKKWIWTVHHSEIIRFEPIHVVDTSDMVWVCDHKQKHRMNEQCKCQEKLHKLQDEWIAKNKPCKEVMAEYNTRAKEIAQSMMNYRHISPITISSIARRLYIQDNNWPLSL